MSKIEHIKLKKVFSEDEAHLVDHYIFSSQDLFFDSEVIYKTFFKKMKKKNKILVVVSCFSYGCLDIFHALLYKNKTKTKSLHEVKRIDNSTPDKCSKHVFLTHAKPPFSDLIQGITGSLIYSGRLESDQEEPGEIDLVQ